MTPWELGKGNLISNYANSLRDERESNYPVSVVYCS